MVCKDAHSISILDFGDELNPDLLDDLLDSVLSEIKAKQNINPKDSEDQIMPSASPNIYETDLMDDIDTPFHTDDSEMSSAFFKPTVLAHQEQEFSMDSFQENWAFDYIEELSERNGSFDDQCNEIGDKCTSGARLHSVESKARVSTDSEMSVAANSNFSSTETTSEKSNCNIPVHFFENHGAKTETPRTISSVEEELKLNKSYHSLRQVPDFQALYPQQASAQVRTNRHQTEDQEQPKQTVYPVSVYDDENSNDTAQSEFLSWRCRHPENWTETEVLDWLFYSAERNGIDTTNLRAESFRVTGRDLCLMRMEDFQRLEPQFGHYFYSWFRQLLNGLSFTQDCNITTYNQPNITIPNDRDVQRFLDNSFSPRSIGQGHHEPDEMYYQHAQSPASPGQCYPYQQSPHMDTECGSIYPTQPLPNNRFYQAYDYSSCEQGPCNGQSYDYNYTNQACQQSDRPSSSYSSFTSNKASVSTVASKYADVVTPRRRPGRPRIKSLPTEEELRLRQEKKLRSQHLWEFIFDLLNNPMYNPQVLKWENPTEGVFRFIQSETIATLWGSLKNNENMTYEKLSRAMRHYYKRGILERVEGRRLVYKFSSTTLQRMQEKRMAAFQNAQNNKAAPASTAASPKGGFNDAASKMDASMNEMSPNISVPQTEHTHTRMNFSNNDVISAPSRLQFIDTHAHAHPIGFGETSHFHDAMLSEEVDLADIAFHSPEGSSNGLVNATELTLPNLENRNCLNVPTIYV